MGAPLGNQFWKLRSKHGRDKIFATPEILLDAACEYFQWCDENPLLDTDFRGKEVQEVKIPKMRAYTLHGLCIFLGVHTKYFNDFEDQIRQNNDELAKDFSNVLTRIREIIYTQKFEGAAAGLLNQAIIARDLALKEVTENTNTNYNKDIDLSKLTDDELRELDRIQRKVGAGKA